MEQLNIFGDITNLAPPIALALCLNVLGYGIKKTKRINSNWIPVILTLAGGAIFPLIAETGDISPSVSNPTAMNVVYGICIGGLSVSFNQIWRKIRGEERDKRTSIPDSGGK